MKSKSIIILLILLLIVSSVVLSFYYFKTDKQKNDSQNDFLTPLKYSKILKVGIDVDFAKTSQGIKYYSKKNVEDFKKIGVSHLRIRILEQNPDEKFLKHLDRVLKDCLDVGIIPIVAFQGANFKENPNTDTLNEVVNWWEIVSKRYKNLPYLVSYDLIIEVTKKLNKQPKILNELYEKVVSKIREVDKKRIIFISPRVRSSPEFLKDLIIPTKHNNFLMVEFHFYASGPSKIKKRKLWTDGNLKEKQLIKNKIKIAKTWGLKNNIYLWVGAWMPSDYNDLNSYSIEEQIVFSKFVSEELKKNNIPFAINSDTKFYNRENNTFKENRLELLKVIIG